MKAAGKDSEGGRGLRGVGQEGTDGPESVGAMRRRRTLMADGRYLIYYTFGDEDETTSAAGEVASPARPEPEAEAVAEEERGV